MSDFEKWYVTEDYYGGVRISTVPTNATNIDGRGSVFENTGRGAGDISQEDAEKIVRSHNDFATLKASHDKLVKVIEAALRISDLWTLGEVETMFEDEAKTLSAMKASFEQALKEAEKIK